MMMDDSASAAPVGVSVDALDPHFSHAEPSSSSYSLFQLAEAQLYNFDFGSPHTHSNLSLLREIIGPEFTSVPPFGSPEFSLGLGGNNFHPTSFTPPKCEDNSHSAPFLHETQVKPISVNISNSPPGPPSSSTTCAPSHKRGTVDISWNVSDSKPDLKSGSKSASSKKSKTKFDSQGNEVSPDDKKVVGKARRLAKNRESARRFRQRQRDHINSLEAQSEILQAANTEIQAKLQLLGSENKILTEQLAHLRTFLKREVTVWHPQMPGMPVPIPLNILNPAAFPGAAPGSIAVLPSPPMDASAFQAVTTQPQLPRPPVTPPANAFEEEEDDDDEEGDDLSLVSTCSSTTSVSPSICINITPGGASN